MEVAVIVVLGKEARLAIDSALDKVHRYSGKLDSGTAGHGQRYIGTTLSGSQRSAVMFEREIM
jgi:hypothetical protein